MLNLINGLFPIATEWARLLSNLIIIMLYMGNQVCNIQRMPNIRSQLKTQNSWIDKMSGKHNFEPTNFLVGQILYHLYRQSTIFYSNFRQCLTRLYKTHYIA